MAVAARVVGAKAIANERAFGEQSGKHLAIDGGVPRADRLVAEKAMGEVGVGGETGPANILAQRFPPVRRGPVDLYGELAGILSLASNAKKPLKESDFSVESIKLVAGARNRLCRLFTAPNLPPAGGHVGARL
jgi:hypothetical protein